MITANDDHEIAKFAALSDQWWDPHGKLATLHAINPVRVDYILSKVDISGKKVMDIGCGGGILAEAMARKGAKVTGIDLCESALVAAKAHAKQSDLKISYLHRSAQEVAESSPETFDVITCLEMLEHTEDPAGVLSAASLAAKPGAALFFSTLNRNMRAFFSAIAGAEYLLGILPKGTHDFSRFIRPAELVAGLRKAGLEPLDIIGLHYHPFTRKCSLSPNVSVNYMVYARKL